MRTPRFLLFAAAFLLLAGFGAHLLADGADDHARQVAAAKAALDASPTAANLAAVEAATAAFEASMSRGPGGSFRAVVGESEPNDTAGTADALVLNTDAGTGDLEPAGDRDWWSMAGVSVGDLYFVLFDSGVSTSGSDTEMSVFEADGTTLIEFDDDSGDGLGSAVAGIIPTAGSMIAELNEFGDNGTIEPYNLFMAAIAPGSVTAETESNDTAATANTYVPPVMSGDTGDGTDDFFTFNANAGDRIAVVCNGDPDDDASFNDCDLAIIDTDMTTTLASEAPFTATGQNAVAATALNSGFHFVSVVGGGADTDYAIIVFRNDAPTPVDLLEFEVE